MQKKSGYLFLYLFLIINIEGKMWKTIYELNTRNDDHKRIWGRWVAGSLSVYPLWMGGKGDDGNNRMEG